MDKQQGRKYNEKTQTQLHDINTHCFLLTTSVIGLLLSVLITQIYFVNIRVLDFEFLD